MAQEARRAQPEAEACWVPKVPRVTLEEWESLVLLDCKVCEDPLEEWVLEEPWVPKENPEKMAEMEKLESLEFRESLVDLVPWETKELRARPESPDLQAPEEILARMEQPVSLDLPDKLDRLEREALWVLLELEDSKACQDHQERMENQAEMEQLACRDLQE